MVIKIYSTPTCHYCDEAKKYFKKHNIKYTEYNVKEDKAKLEEMIKISGVRSVPIIDLGKQIMQGWSEESFKRLYE